MSGYTPYNHAMPDWFNTEETQVIARFTIPGNPTPKGRPRAAGNRMYTPAKTVLAEQSVLAAFTEAFPDWEPVEYHIDLTTHFYRDSKRIVDADNMAKLVQDALNKKAFRDDSQIVDLHAHKWFTTKDRARTEVVIARVLGDRNEVTA